MIDVLIRRERDTRDPCGTREDHMERQENGPSTDEGILTFLLVGHKPSSRRFKRGLIWLIGLIHGHLLHSKNITAKGDGRARLWRESPWTGTYQWPVRMWTTWQ